MSAHPKNEDDMPGDEPPQSAGGAVGYNQDDEDDGLGESGPSRSGGGSVG